MVGEIHSSKLLTTPELLRGGWLVIVPSWM